MSFLSRRSFWFGLLVIFALNVATTLLLTRGNRSAPDPQASTAASLAESWARADGVPVSVRAFGAKGDGVTDDTAAFLAALRFALANGRSVFVPGNRSTVYVVGHIAVDTGQLVLFGEATLRLKAGTNKALLWVRASAAGCVLRGLHFEGNSAAQTHQADRTTPYDENAGLVVISCQNPVLDGISVHDTRLLGIRVSAYADSNEELRGVEVRNCTVTSADGGGIAVTFARQPVITGCRVSEIGGRLVQASAVTGNTITTASPLVHRYNPRVACFRKTLGGYDYIGSVARGAPVDGTNVSVSGPTLIGAAGSLAYSPNLYLLGSLDAVGISASNCHNARIENCHAELTSSVGIILVQDRGGSGAIVGCTAYAVGEESFTLDGCRGSLISSCSARQSSVNSDSPAIHVANASPGIVEAVANSVVGCTVRDSNGGISAGLQTGRGSGMTATKISGNNLYRSPSAQYTAGPGISTVGVDDVSGNTVQGYETGIDVVTGDGTSVTGNRLIGYAQASGSGVRITNAARTSILANTIRSFTHGIRVENQGACQMIGNTLRDVTTCFSTKLPAGRALYEMTWIANACFGYATLLEQKPGYWDDPTGGVTLQRWESRVHQPREAYTAPVVLKTTSAAATLMVEVDHDLQFPVKRIYSLSSVGSNYVLVEIGSSVANPGMVDAAATRNPTTGEITLTVSGSGDGKALAYELQLKSDLPATR